MRITEIKAYPAWIGFRNQLLVKVETDAGFYGWGESGLSGRELAVAGAVEHYRDFLIGKDPRQIGSLWQEMYRGQYFEGGRVLTAAISAIDTALHDLVAKSLNVPVFQLLGGKQRDYVECFASIPASRTVDEAVVKAKLLVAEGWNSFRINPSYDSSSNEGPFDTRKALAQAVEFAVAVRETVGSEPTIGYDLHSQFSLPEMASFLQRLPKGTLDYIEEPIRAESPDAYRALRTMTDVPFAVGEEFSSKWAFQPFLDKALIQYARIDLANVGGFTESMKIAAMAEVHYIDVMPHNPLGPVGTASMIHMSAALPNFSWLESRQSPAEDLQTIDEEIFTKYYKLDGSVYNLTEEAGLGVEINEDKLASLELKKWEPPHLRRQDGSYTNW